MMFYNLIVNKVQNNIYIAIEQCLQICQIGTLLGIGKKPKPLAFGLYRHLITNDIWAQQRYEFGYKNVRPHPLIMSFPFNHMLT